MTAPEIDNEFLTLYDRVSHASAPSLDGYERSVILTKAQENIIKRKITPKSNKNREGFEMSEKRMSDINDILKFDTPTLSGSQTGATDNGLIYDLADDFWLAVREEASINKLNCRTNLNIIASVDPVTNDFVRANLSNPFKNPYYNEYEASVWRLRSGKDTSLARHELITDGTFSVTEYRMWYIKKPQPIIVETLPPGLTIEGQSIVTASELNDMVIREVIDEAVRIATNVTNPSESNIKSSEMNLNE